MKSSFLRDLFALVSSRIVVTLLTVGTSIITARYLGPDINGIIAALTVYPLLFMTIGSLGIQQSTTYFVGQNKYNIREIYGSVLVIWIFTSIFCMLSCYTLISYFSANKYNTIYIYMAILPIPFSLYNTYSSGIFLGLQNIKEYNKVNWISAAINFAATFVLLAIFHFGLPGPLMGIFAGVFILSFFVAHQVKKIVPIRPILNLKIIKAMLSLGLIYALEVLIFALNYRVDIILLEKLSTPYEIGIYSKGVNIVEVLWQIPLFVSALIFSRSAGSKDPKGFSEKVCRLLRFAGVVIVFSSIALYLLSGIVITVMYGDKFIGSIIVLKTLIPGVLLLTILRILNMDLAGKGKPWLSMRAMIPAVIINIIFNYFLVPKYGALGAAWSTTISYSCAAIIFLFVYSREVGIPVLNILKYTLKDKEIAVEYFNIIRSKAYSFLKIKPGN